MFTDIDTYNARNRLTGETMSIEATCETEARHAAAAHWGVCWDSLRVRKVRRAMDDAVVAFNLGNESRQAGMSDAYAHAQTHGYIFARTFPEIVQAFFDNGGPDMPKPEGYEDACDGMIDGFTEAGFDTHLGY